MSGAVGGALIDGHLYPDLFLEFLITLVKEEYGLATSFGQW